MNVFLIEDQGGVTMYDAGTEPMIDLVADESAKRGGLKRIVLGHGDTDHRGTAPHLPAPVLCHPEAVSDIERTALHPDYWDHSKLEYLPGRLAYIYLHRRWDGGPAKVAGTVSEGEEIAGFEVVHFPGHARGLIGLWRERDGVALVSDTVYLVDSARLKRLPPGTASVPHPAFNLDTPKARDAVRKLASLRPRKVWTGHAEALEGDPGWVAERLEAAAEVRFPRE